MGIVHNATDRLACFKAVASRIIMLNLVCMQMHSRAKAKQKKERNR